MDVAQNSSVEPGKNSKDGTMKSFFHISRVGSLRLTAIAIVATAALAYGYNSYFKDFKDLVSLHEGISTCSHRVTQTFTAKMIGDKNSVYLQNDFMNLTEDCFADTIASFNANLASKLSLVGSQINGLASETHNLHERILVASTSVNDLGKIYERIESGRNIVIDEIGNSSLKNQGTQSLMLFSLIAAFLIMSMIVIRGLWEALTEYNQNMRLEEMAREQLSSQEDDRASKMEEILSQTLRQNNLTFMTQMFQSFKNYWQDKALVNTVQSPQAFKLKARLDEVEANKTNWNQDRLVAAQVEAPRSNIFEAVTTITNSEARTDSVNLTDTIAKVINLLSGKAFSNGVVLDFDLSQTYHVKGNQDAVSQVVFNLLSHAINNNLSNQNMKTIKAELKTVGDRITLKLVDNSQVYTDELVREINSQMNTISDLGFSVCKEFVNELRGELTVKNILNADGGVSHSVTELTMIVAPSKTVETGTRLVSYVKGKKKDFKKKNRGNRYDNRYEQSL